jgi:hypothetical protein
VKPTFRVQRGASVDQVQDEVKRVLDELGNFGSKELPLRAVGPNETRIAHGLGRVPDRWRLYSHQDGATIQETRPPDSKYLYLRNVKPVASLADEDWASSVKRRMLALAGIDPGRASFYWETFQAGKSTSFPGWVRAAPGAGSLTHGTSDRGGVARWTYTTPFVPLPANTLFWDGEEVFASGAAERCAIAFRLTASGIFDAGNEGSYLGMADPAFPVNGFLVVGLEGSIDATHVSVVGSGPTTRVSSSTTWASLATETEIILVQRPEGGVRTGICFIGGEEVGRVQFGGTTAPTGRVPMMFINEGDWAIDDVAWVTDGALGGSAVDPLSAATDGDAGSATVGIEVL